MSKDGLDYFKVDHAHCWDQETPACGLDKHTQCCLCREEPMYLCSSDCPDSKVYEPHVYHLKEMQRKIIHKEKASEEA